MRLPDIEKAVCEVFGVEPDEPAIVRQRRASQPAADAGHVAGPQSTPGRRLSEIGQYFGRRSHSTVISAEKKVNSWRASGAEVQLAHGTCGVDDAIRRLELRLRCG